MVLVQTAAELPREDLWMSDWERGHAATLRFPKRLQDWKLGRWTAKLALRRYLQNLPGELETRIATDGAPAPNLAGEPAPASLSISHSRGVAIAAVGHPGIELGCDLEYIEAHTVEFVTDYFTADEVMLARSAPPDRQPLLCTLIWSAKESVLKALRDGLRRDTRTVSVGGDLLGTGKTWARFSVRCSDPDGTFDGWWKLHGGFVLTLAERNFPDPPIEIQGLHPFDKVDTIICGTSGIY
jgi:4'-phosphopantetheinyl transferase